MPQRNTRRPAKKTSKQSKRSTKTTASGAMANIKRLGRGFYNWLRAFLRANWKGLLVITLATIIFFWPVLVRLGTYSEGGDAMFNAWTLARDHHCLLRQNCPNFADGNIYFPNKDTMLYSETQLSVGLVSLPLRLISQNPIFYNNVMTVFSMFMIGFFMYLLAKHLSRNQELLSIMAGLIFEFSPYRMPAVWHLQNLSICMLPLAVLMILKFVQKPLKRYIIVLFLSLSYVFFASWVQMVFVLMVVGVLLLGLWVFKMARHRQLLIAATVVFMAILCTLPLMKQYIDFSKQSNAKFGLSDQIMYSSSLADYFIPHSGTLLGKLLNVTGATITKNSYNPDSASYMGFGLYGVAFLSVFFVCRYRKSKPDKGNDAKLIALFSLVGLIGFVISLGPLLKVFGSYTYGWLPDGSKLTFPLPWLAINKIFPQLSFIRAIGRAAAITLFALCCLLAIYSHYSRRYFSQKQFRISMGIVIALIVVEILPAHTIAMSPVPYTYHWSIPKVYKYIKNNDSIDRILILNTDLDYKDAPLPIARAEQVLWAGYHNKNIFNGYSGYEPAQYKTQLGDFKDFTTEDVPKLKKLGIRYVLLDKSLVSKTPDLHISLDRILPARIYSDERFNLYQIQ